MKLAEYLPLINEIVNRSYNKCQSIVNINLFWCAALTIYLIKVVSARCWHANTWLKYIHSEVFRFFLITFVKLKGTCHETYHMIAKVDPVLLVKFGGVW